MPLHRLDSYNKQQIALAKLSFKHNRFRPCGFQTTLFILSMPGSKFARDIQDMEATIAEGMGWRVHVIEQSGNTLKSQIETTTLCPRCHMSPSPPSHPVM